MHSLDVAAVLLRATLGLTMLAHGWNHVFGGGKIAGTARWFASIGMRPPLVHAWVASVSELGCGALLLAGALTPLACGGVLGTMVVALTTNHLRNGFFIFRPGEGYEYVLMISIVAVALAGVGAGYLSIDHAVDLPLSGFGAILTCVGLGFGGAGLTVATSWRPQAEPEPQ
ncbi:DoxX family protein [Jatrophihabitans cynanchi]|jgi:putative oxidoreductase|uniref:DoxX family protein n=1 Tax=Jatrophihabitans cynanchi TaxID=2944128 RepID=A0ABY7K2X3_9ACTN|nr:DoxX family protein [Jatrophihabitans sp. SB3-54]WAX58350.1 DoxX family protein [Jatrophihabitans sp. SB3-54]